MVSYTEFWFLCCIMWPFETTHIGQDLGLICIAVNFLNLLCCMQLCTPLLPSYALQHHKSSGKQQCFNKRIMGCLTLWILRCGRKCFRKCFPGFLLVNQSSVCSHAYLRAFMQDVLGLIYTVLCHRDHRDHACHCMATEQRRTTRA